MPAVAQTRITGGEWRGRLLSTPRERVLRPTRAVVREAIFNILGDAVIGARFVDLFAGAGTVGFEALSRGAAHVTFVDSAAPALDHVARSADRLGCVDRCAIVRADALRWVRGHGAEVAAAGVTFVDAPYRDDSVLAVLAALGASPPRVVVCEHHRARALPDAVGALTVSRRTRFGITELSVLRADGREDGPRD